MGAWWAAVFGVTQSWTRLMRLSSSSSYPVSPHLNKFLTAVVLKLQASESFPVSQHFVKSESEVAQLCLTFSDPMDCSLPGSSVHGIFQARVLEWGAIAFSVTG